MSRRDRRAALARGKTTGAEPADISQLAAEATSAYQQGRGIDAEVLCKRILGRDPAHPTALNILGILYQASGHHRLAAKTLAKALAVNALDAAGHYNIATSYQAMGQRDTAAEHFNKAIALGLSGKGVEPFLLQNPVIVECASRAADKFGFPAKTEAPLSATDVAALADNVFLRCALESTIIRGITLEQFLTRLRSALLDVATAGRSDPAGVDDDVVGLFCALARQCFLNEYVFPTSADETRRAGELRELLLQQLAAGSAIPSLLLAAVGAYGPLHSLAEARSLLAAAWPAALAGLIRQQVREPLEEADDRPAIPKLTPVDDHTSLEVMRQYEENPYPRWSVNPLAALGRNLTTSVEAGDGSSTAPPQQILIAGCGTGEHPFDVAQKSPNAQILAVDLSVVSLAYARRKTREEGLRNIEYAQADILNMSGLARRFDRIETVGVLHHLADPMRGWRVLLALLSPDGIMRVGLYSAAARRSIVEARALVAARGYQATAVGIRELRRTIIGEKNDVRWQPLIQTVDFYSMSGCRDMFFNVMEHRLGLPEIKSFLDEQGFRFLGFELDPKVIEKFQELYPGPGALVDLDAWNAYEAANPQTFINMYMFSICRK